jgi:hypothetical protein
MLRYPLTALLPGEAMGGQRVLDDLPGYARARRLSSACSTAAYHCTT